MFDLQHAIVRIELLARNINIFLAVIASLSYSRDTAEVIEITDFKLGFISRALLKIFNY